MFCSFLFGSFRFVVSCRLVYLCCLSVLLFSSRFSTLPFPSRLFSIIFSSFLSYVSCAFSVFPVFSSIIYIHIVSWLFVYCMLVSCLVCSCRSVSFIVFCFPHFFYFLICCYVFVPCIVLFFCSCYLFVTFLFLSCLRFLFSVMFMYCLVLFCIVVYAIWPWCSCIFVSFVAY